ncbi:hypothetical protein [Gimesia fumaroli]|uniref:Uncharacterized protein n=1 Tax=Gimesia fumaroli TaxID=2527976 RepID=A0A518I910_9PLAN|nr:hypothetical protein [Gimesia fumaroli]QDV49591.1 hypothetical protein Enr17x_16110 [Gimesia fumaroli]
MSKMTIRKKRIHGNTEYELIVNSTVVDGLPWDEMLGRVARCFIRDWFVGLSEDRCVKRSGRVLEYELHIEEVDGHYLITRGDCFISHLTFDEMLGFIAKYTLIGTQMFSGLRTYEEWSKLPYRDREIAGLLPAPSCVGKLC